MLNLSVELKKDFMKKAAFIADKSSCLYKIGCVGVIADTQQFIDDSVKHEPQFRRSNGYVYLKTWNETIPGELYCQQLDKSGRKICIREVENLKGRDFQKVCSIHAEMNLLAKCGRYGISTNGMSLFVTNAPCYVCSKAIIQSGISEVYYMSSHTDMSGLEIMKSSGVKCEMLSDIFNLV